MKLIEKTRVGSKITKKYDKPLTPYQRVLLHVPQAIGFNTSMAL